jgi:hypothetical protein
MASLLKAPSNALLVKFNKTGCFLKRSAAGTMSHPASSASAKRRHGRVRHAKRWPKRLLVGCSSSIYRSEEPGKLFAWQSYLQQGTRTGPACRQVVRLVASRSFLAAHPDHTSQHWYPSAADTIQLAWAASSRSSTVSGGDKPRACHPLGPRVRGASA